MVQDFQGFWGIRGFDWFFSESLGCFLWLSASKETRNLGFLSLNLNLEIRGSFKGHPRMLSLDYLLPRPLIPSKFLFFASLGLENPQTSSPMVEVTLGNPTVRYDFRYAKIAKISKLNNFFTSKYFSLKLCIHSVQVNL